MAKCRCRWMVSCFTGYRRTPSCSLLLTELPPSLAVRMKRFPVQKSFWQQVQVRLEPFLSLLLVATCR